MGDRAPEAGRRAPCGTSVPQDHVQRGLATILAGWPMDRVPIERIGAVRNLCAVVPGRRDREADLEGGGNRAVVATGRYRPFVPWGKRHADGGRDHVVAGV